MAEKDTEGSIGGRHPRDKKEIILGSDSKKHIRKEKTRTIKENKK